MKLKSLGIFAAMVIAGSSTVLSAQTATKKASQITGKYYSELLKNEKIITTSSEKNTQLKMIPVSEYASQIKSDLVKKGEKSFSFTYESLYFITGKTITVQKASELARTISGMQGIKYYSNTKKKEMVLYSKAYTVSAENSDTAVSDKNTGNADGMTLYCLMDDNSFGVNHYRLNYKQSQTELLTTFTITDDMGLGPIRTIMPENLKIHLLIIPCEEGIVVYMCTDLDSKNVPGVKGKITESMTARMDAISKWFISLI